MLYLGETNQPVYFIGSLTFSSVVINLANLISDVKAIKIQIIVDFFNSSGSDHYCVVLMMIGMLKINIDQRCVLTLFFLITILSSMKQFSLTFVEFRKRKIFQYHQQENNVSCMICTLFPFPFYVHDSFIKTKLR